MIFNKHQLDLKFKLPYLKSSCHLLKNHVHKGFIPYINIIFNRQQVQINPKNKKRFRLLE